ncbi:MAG: AtpZ/AtpI family protein [Desulfobacterales bacterium]|jgi:F0F1-type ATP synthase assembly protein I|nr:AtpZ/AtpI family protein [Desulfobacterales bacterium]
MIATQKINHKQYQGFTGVLMLSAWGMAMVIASFLFLYIGHLLDEMLGTAPNFMLGLFMLAIFICVMRLYQEAKQRMKEL